MAEGGPEHVSALKRALDETSRELAASKRLCAALRHDNEEAAHARRASDERLAQLCEPSKTGELSTAVEVLVMRGTQATVGEAMAATSAANDLVAYMQLAGSKSVLAVAVYSGARGYTRYCDEDHTIGYRLVMSKLHVVVDELVLGIDAFEPSDTDREELFNRQRPVEEYDPSKHSKLVDSLLKTRKRAARETLEAATGDALRKQLKLLTEHLKRTRGICDLDVDKDVLACVNGVVERQSNGQLAVRDWKRTDLLSRNTGVDVGRLPRGAPITLDGYESTFTSRSIERFLPNESVRTFITTLFLHRALGHHQKFGVLFLGPANYGKSTHILLLMSAFGGTACMAATECFKTDSNAALNAFTNSSVGMAIVYIDDIERTISEAALKRSGNGVPIVTRRPGTGEPQRPARPALVVLSANPDTVQQTFAESVQPKLMVVPPSAMAAPNSDSGVDLIDDVVAGVYAAEALEYQLRCYNAHVAATEALPTALVPPAIMSDASSDLAAYGKRLQPVTPEMEQEFRSLVQPVLHKRREDKYVRAEELKAELLAHSPVAKLCGITKAPGYGALKLLMNTVYNTKFVQSARLSGHRDPVSSCFLNPAHGRPVHAHPA